MTFYCNKCEHEFEIKEEGYWNYRCPKCTEFCLPKGKLPPASIWKTSTGTVRRREFRQKHKRKG